LSFPRLYVLECEKDVSVAAKLIDSSLTSSFRRNPRGGIEEDQYLLFVETVAPVILSNSSDRWVWTLDSAGDFSVKSVRTLIDHSFLPSVAMYGVCGSLDNPGNLSWHSPWYDIIKEAGSLSLKCINLMSYVKKKVGNGEHIFFWEDVWLTDRPLKLSFPRLYVLECEKDVSVAAKLIDSSLTRLFKGILIDNSLTLSHLFYADDAVFIGKCDKSNLVTIVNEVNSAASLIGYTTLSTPFNYLGVKVGTPSSRNSSGDEVLSKISYRLSKWKLKAFSIGGRLTLLKSVLSFIPLYHMSIYKVPMGVLNRMESLRRNFSNGVDNKERKISMIGWKKVLASKKKRGSWCF
nr:RNA-directed DNA polymerase, eukaryota [Tanacetum cinerariifolium]